MVNINEPIKIGNSEFLIDKVEISKGLDLSLKIKIYSSIGYEVETTIISSKRHLESQCKLVENAINNPQKIAELIMKNFVKNFENNPEFSEKSKC